MAASYPTSVKTFATRSNGQTIDATHVNDLQDEVNAIEDGVINGTAHLQSSNSTLAALSVSGGSTLAGTLQVSSASTFALRPTMPPPQEMVRVFTGSTLTLGSSGASTLTWDTLDWNTNSSVFSTATNPNRFTPQSTGVFMAVCQVTLSSASTASIRTIVIEDSSGVAVGTARALNPASPGEGTIHQAIAYKRFDVTGGFLSARLSLAGTSTLSVSTGTNQTWMTVHKL